MLLFNFFTLMTQNPKETTEAAAVEPHNLRLSRVS